MNSKGQSLVELLVAVALGVVVIAGALRLMNFLTRSSAYDPVAQTGALLAVDLMNSATAAAAGSWPAIASATAGAHYYLTAGGSGFSVTPGDEIKLVNIISYSRYFTVSSVMRDTNDGIAAIGNDDPSTKKITVMVSWMYAGKPYNHTIEQYVARTQNEVSRQTDWVGGPACLPGADPQVGAQAVNNRFCTSTLIGVDYISKPGSIKIQGY